ncbi:MAG: thermonuclease family protein [Anaerolineae bacterium]|nr:thermonuclease family protein [Anaerolineae bacterium]
MRRMIIPILLLCAACSFTYGFEPAPNGSSGGSAPATGEQVTVLRVIDGDTIDVQRNNETERVRYIGMNTPERDEPCYAEATRANAALVEGKQVILVKDTSETDRYGRLLRYIYVGGVFVNARLVEEGYAEVVSYPPDTGRFTDFRQLEQQAQAANRGCHPTGIFNDNSYER